MIRAHGADAYYRYGKQTHRTPDACRMHIQRTERDAWLEAMAEYRRNAFAKQEAKPKNLTEQQAVAADAFWDRFVPVQMPAPPKRSTQEAQAGVTVVASDFHFPLQDDAAVAIFLETIRQLKPEQVILNGDLPDLLALSRYPKDVRNVWGLQEEAAGYAALLHELEQVMPKGAALYEIDANHSGNGTESRWWRYLSERIPELLGHPRAKEEMTYQKWWHPEWSRVQMRDELVLGHDLLITHGDMARKWGGYTAKAHSERYVNSVMHGHTHRQGSHIRRVPAVGNRGEQTIRAYEIGCMCRLDPGYTKVPDWTQGFAIVVTTGSHYSVELVTIENGAAVIGALGVELRG
jgi:predicted phosphodiesterase